jgi:hypothetical protein
VRALMLAALCVGLVLPAGCNGAETRPPEARRTPAHLGGENHDRATPPAAPMTPLEQAITRRLSHELDDQRIALDYLDCPRTAEASPTRMICQGYSAGVLVDVHVALHGRQPDVAFDARLGTGVLATANLVDRLESAGYRDVDCGDRAAYPTVVGDQIVCSVSRAGRHRYVVATVTTTDGEVAISDY